MKIFIGILVLIGIAGFILWAPADAPTGNTDEPTVGEGDLGQEATSEAETGQLVESAQRTAPAEGAYIVNGEESTVAWAGQKPFIDGYINTGSIAVTDGSIAVGEEGVTGAFTINMNTLSVSDTPTKPGSESALEGHLKGERWFDVGTYPEASFTITSVTARADSDTTFVYDVEGELTMKGVTDTLSFPAEIYQDTDDRVYASADFEFDRTKWGITAGSASFFDSLADNAVDDMVALSFELVAERQ